jgi:hypothetical protein
VHVLRVLPISTEYALPGIIELIYAAQLQSLHEADVVYGNIAYQPRILQLGFRFTF